MGYIREYTPLYCDDERINILWLWCMENYDKFDPRRGNLTAWVLGVSRRIIDEYRKERGSRRKTTIQFPLVETKDNRIISSENLLPDNSLHHEEYIDKKDDIDLMWKTIDQQLSKPDNRAILQNYAQTLSDQFLGDSLNVSKGTMQTRRTQYKRKVQDALRKKNVRDR